jgi:hypothetical protein
MVNNASELLKTLGADDVGQRLDAMACEEQALRVLLSDGSIRFQWAEIDHLVAKISSGVRQQEVSPCD